MRRVIAGSLFLLWGQTSGLAADLPSVWAPPEYDAIQATSVANDKVMSVLFDNFIVDAQGGGDLVARKMLGTNFPLKLGTDEAVTELKADIRGAFLHDGEAGGTLIALVGNEIQTMRFPTEDEANGGGDFAFSFSTTERFPNGSSIPITIIVVAQRTKIEDSVSFAIDSIDMAVATE